MGQKSTKHKDSDGEPAPSPRKSPKRSGHHSARSASFERSPPLSGSSSVEDRGGEGGKENPITASSASQSLASASSEKESQSEQLMDYDQKENVPSYVLEKSSPRTPSKMSGKEPVKEPFTPRSVNEIVNYAPQATSTPAPNGIISTGQVPLSVSIDSDQDHTDQSDDEAFTPTDQQFQFRGHSPSPSTGSLVSQSTTSSYRKSNSRSDSYERRQNLDYGKFYNTSYLSEGKSNYLKKSASLPKKDLKSPHFHRPPNFSYARDPPEFLKSRKSGMAALASGNKVIVKRTRRASSPAELKQDEAVRLSMFPGGKPPKPDEIIKIEREDWPGPPSPAAILPELMRQRRKSRGEADDDEEELPKQDPKIQKEIQEISKFKDQSGIGKIIYKELEESLTQPPKPLDPWKASRVPGADHEPRYSTRYQSPMFASPSRFVDRPKRSWDDSDIRRGYRTISTLANYPVPRPGYGLSSHAATLPVSGQFGGALSFRYFDFEDHELRPRPSAYTSTSTMNTEHESHTTSSILGGQGISIISLQRSTWHTDVEPTIYPYDRLKISHFDLPKDVDRNMLEIHLATGDFKDIFKMNKEEFSKLAEWKRNDLKRKVDLF